MYLCPDDFYRQAASATRLTREEECACAESFAKGDSAARQKLIESYLPQVAAPVRRAPKHLQTLRTIYAALTALEQGVDTFDFLQTGETFTHHLSWRLRQCITRCIAES